MKERWWPQKAESHACTRSSEREAERGRCSEKMYKLLRDFERHFASRAHRGPTIKERLASLIPRCFSSDMF